MSERLPGCPPVLSWGGSWGWLCVHKKHCALYASLPWTMVSKMDPKPWYTAGYQNQAAASAAADFHVSLLRCGHAIRLAETLRGHRDTVAASLLATCIPGLLPRLTMPSPTEHCS